MFIRETIHHGDFRNVREVEVPDDVETALALVGRTSPYPFEFDLGNQYHEKATEQLKATGRASIGWARFEVIVASVRSREQVREDLREEIDTMFSRLVDRWQLPSGDVDPLEELRWEEETMPAIERYVWHWYHGNQIAQLPDRVTGDWEPDGISYPARITRSWSGGVEWQTDRATVELIIARQQQLRAEPGGPSDFSELRWEGETLVQLADDGETYRYEPDAEGLYECSFGWSWVRA